MQSLGRRYVQYVNKEYRRSGMLWEGRHKASIVDAEDYLLLCMRYIELNPVRAGIVFHPADYRWSSYRVNGQGEQSAMIVPHDIFTGLGGSREERCYRYRCLFDNQLDEGDIHSIRKSTEFSVPLGNKCFVEQIVVMLGRCVGNAKRGRPSV